MDVVVISISIYLMLIEYKRKGTRDSGGKNKGKKEQIKRKGSPWSPLTTSFRPPSKVYTVATLLLMVINGVHDPENQVPEATGVKVSSDAREPPSPPLTRH